MRYVPEIPLISIPITSKDNSNKRLKSLKSGFVASIFDVYRFKTWFRVNMQRHTKVKNENNYFIKLHYLGNCVTSILVSLKVYMSPQNLRVHFH